MIDASFEKFGNFQLRVKRMQRTDPAPSCICTFISNYQQPIKTLNGERSSARNVTYAIPYNEISVASMRTCE